MGYVFDAMNRTGDDEPAKQPPKEQVAPAQPVRAQQAAPQAPAEKVNREPGENQSVPPRMPKLPPKPVDPAVTNPGAGATAAGSPSPILLAPADIAKLDDRLVGLTNPESIMAEEYRSIRTSTLARWEQKRNLVHTITSATPQEGKTITSLNLGLIFAELRNRRTIVIECDLRLPTFAKLLPLHEGPGLIDYLSGKATLEQVIQQIGERPLHVIPAGGRANSQAVQMLTSTVMADLLKRLRRDFDHVIIDTPPVLELADAGILGALSDDVMLVARMNRTPRTLVEQAIRTLASYSAPVAGLIATDQKRTRGRYYAYRYGYRYGYGYGYHDGEKRAA